MKKDSELYNLSQELGLCYIEKIEGDINHDLITKIPIAFAKKYELIPVNMDQETLTVATSKPLNIYPLDDLRILFNKKISISITEPEIIESAIHKYYAVSANSAEQAMTDLTDDENLESISIELDEPKDLLDMSDEAPIIRLINSLLHQAVKDRASDIHIEPFETEILVRFRIDGILYNIITPPKQYQSFIISRIKVMAGLNIAEKRLPQDGRIRLKIAGKNVDVRVSVLPTVYGERIVMRLLERSETIIELSEIGLSTTALTTMNSLIHQSHGIVLVTGPTGSGKTTTLYTALSKINKPDKNIITVEDPIEYQIKGIGQIQVNPKIDLTFANGLRSILRQDPDVIMIGEIRDGETAEIAIHASLTGHLVFSTLHTNDSAGAATRLVDMGIEPFLVSSSVAGIMAQRLVRVLCENCKLPYTPSQEELNKIGKDQHHNSQVKTTLYRSSGCDKCKDTGYIGRKGIYELLIIDEKIRELINTKADSNEIKKLAIKNGMITLKQDGIEKVFAGITTIEEVLRVTQTDL